MHDRKLGVSGRASLGWQGKSSQQTKLCGASAPICIGFDLGNTLKEFNILFQRSIKQFLHLSPSMILDLCHLNFLAYNMNWKNYSPASTLAIALITVGGIFHPIDLRGEISGGFGTMLSLNVGTISQSSVGIQPTLWLSSLSDDKSGWTFGLDYSNPEPSGASGLNNSQRLATWVMRNTGLRFKNMSFRVNGGIGWGLWKYNLLGSTRYRGAMGFKSVVETDVFASSLSGIDFGIGYEGLNVPGVGGFDDLLFLQIRYRLF